MMARHRHAWLNGTCACGAGTGIVALNRRRFLAGAAASGLVATGVAPVRAQTAGPPPVTAPGAAAARTAASGTASRIDVHHHLSPPTWLAAVQKAGLDNPPMNDWTPQRSLQAMDEAGVALSVTSPTTPQVGFLQAADAARLARESNEYALRLQSDHPGRFATFAMLPLPHVDASLAEIAYAFDALKVAGIGMMTNYGNRWLGHPDFAPVFAELNRRKAVVYTHPTDADCCVNLVRGIPSTTIEYGANTTRAIADLIFSGAAQRYPDITFIFSHGGGVLTAVAERFEVQMVTTPPYKGKFTRADVDGQLRRFYYDTAQISNAPTLGALLQLVPASQVVFGSDYPYRTPKEHVIGLAERLSPEQDAAIARGNALRIMPGLLA